MTLTYLIGRQYIESKKSRDRNWDLFPQNEGIKETAQKIAKQSGTTSGD